MSARGVRADPGGMTRLASASLELRIVAAVMLAAAGVRSVGLLVEGRAADRQALAAGFLGGVTLLWRLWGARAVRTAIRLALPAQAPREPAWVTAVRVLAVQAVPICAVLLGAGFVLADRAALAPAIAAGVLLGAGTAAVLGARGMRRAERRLGRRLLRRPRPGVPLRRSSLFLESRAPSGARPAPSARPWPAHLPPSRPQGTSIELDPANPPARHPVGVRPTRARAPQVQPPPVSPPRRRGHRGTGS